LTVKKPATCYQTIGCGFRCNGRSTAKKGLSVKKEKTEPHLGSKYVYTFESVTEICGIICTVKRGKKISAKQSWVCKISRCLRIKRKSPSDNRGDARKNLGQHSGLKKAEVRPGVKSGTGNGYLAVASRLRVRRTGTCHRNEKGLTWFGYERRPEIICANRKKKKGKVSYSFTEVTATDKKEDGHLKIQMLQTAGISWGYRSPASLSFSCD